MASLKGATDLRITIDGRDEDTVRRFHDRLQERLPELVQGEAARFAGVEFVEAQAVTSGLVVRG